MGATHGRVLFPIRPCTGAKNPMFSGGDLAEADRRF